MQFTDPSNNTNFSYVGKRTTGTRAVLVVGRVFVENEGDPPSAYHLARQIQLAPLE